jgi:hypothetical protein
LTENNIKNTAATYKRPSHQGKGKRHVARKREEYCITIFCCHLIWLNPPSLLAIKAEPTSTQREEILKEGKSHSHELADYGRGT